MNAPKFPPAPDGGDQPVSDVAGLVREIDLLRRRVDSVVEVTSGLPERVDEIAGLVAKLTDALAAATARRRPEPAPSWLLAPSEPGDVRTLLQELCAWLVAVFLRYPDGRSVLPECWLWHPDVVEELLWLMHAWCAAYQGANASVSAAGDWHDRQRPGVVARLRKAAGSCSPERHQTRPGWPAEPSGPTEAPGLNHVELIVGWWAERRDQAAPEPDPVSPMGGVLG